MSSGRKIYERSTTYRKVYFKYNKGIFHKWYLCAYCRNVFLEQEIVEVDHVIPVNAVKTKPYYRFLFWIIGKDVNYHINLVAACRKCNRAKSDKSGKLVYRGYYGGLQHAILQAISNSVVDIVKNYWWVLLLLISAVVIGLAYLLSKIL